MKPSLLLGEDTHQDLLQLLRAKQSLVLSGASNETAKAILVAQFFHLSPGKMLYIAPNAARRDGTAKWLSFFGVPVHSISLTEGVFPPEELPSYLSFFTSSDASVLLLSEDEWRSALPSLSEFEDRKLALTTGQSIDFTDFFEKLIERGYQHGEDLYLQPGEYRKIGDTLDIYPAQSEHPFRVLFSFETIESIKAVDPEDLSRSEASNAPLTLYPASWKKTESLSRQLSNNHVLILDDIEEEEVQTKAPTLFFTAFPQSEENHVHVRYLSVLKFYTVSDFLNDIRDKLDQNWRLVIVTKRAEELCEILSEESISFHDGSSNKTKSIITVSSGDEALPHSLQNPDLKCAMLTDREIFTLRKEGRQRSIQKLALDFITSLQPGDYVVHMDHGIGRFTRVTQKTVDAVTREYLELQYDGTDRLFIPIDQADKLSKFVHEEGEEPLLSRLGSNDWKKVTAKIKSETAKIAKDLLQIYAKRAKSRGHAYGEDSRDQRTFEEGFEYVETPGQLKAIQDIKQDMEDPHPMDRLICGDVGFGKTEVAMRAAFKAVQNGKQVALVSPITILADQHFRTLQKRMNGFPIRMDMLSRFRKPAEQKVILEKLRKGDIDIVVGTHRLLQDDVKFLNLGLLIIDEEQRFGVRQKEKMKSLRASVDILTLTATPIPRTLNLGLHKLRDITTITTPPPGRLPIITEVRKYSDALVRQAIMSEIGRDGQIYVLHNRVETIDAFADKLRKLVPEGKFIVSHGQLKPDQLETRIMDFKTGKYQVLVSSTIIENGIDLPRANTLIVNQAERFGLSQLYQLRGRVGRGKLQAYAYFLYHTQRLKDDAKKRLRAIVEASELGSGFQISMRDLEIRGAGEILGANQSGHMKTAGVSHYLRMLKQAVEELRSGKGEEVAEEETVEINLPIEAFIPGYYVPDEQEKVSVYQKLAGSGEEEILREFEEDLIDEYGNMPQQVKNLFRVLRLKIVCKRAGITRVKAEIIGKKTDIVLSLSKRVTAKHLLPLLARNPKWKVSGSTLRIDQAELGEQWFRKLKEDTESIVLKKAKP